MTDTKTQEPERKSLEAPAQQALEEQLKITFDSAPELEAGLKEKDDDSSSDKKSVSGVSAGPPESDSKDDPNEAQATAAAPPAKKPSAAPGAKAGGLWKPVRILGRVALFILMGIGMAVMIGLGLALSFGIAAANGAIMLLIGNVVLKATNHAGYTDNGSAAAVGAVGAVFASMIVGTVSGIFPKSGGGDGEEPKHPFYVQVISAVLVGTLSGAIGCSILRRAGHALGGLNVLHATRAGAVGGAILAPAAILIVPVVLFVMGLILAPLWLGVMSAARWASSQGAD